MVTEEGREKRKKKFLRIRAVMDRTGISRSGVYTMVYKGQFPQPYKLGEKAVGWLEEDVENWIDERIQCGQARLGANCAADERAKNQRGCAA